VLYFFQRNGEFSSNVITFSAQVRVLDLDKLKNNVAGSSLHSLISHVCISQVRIAGSSRSNLKGELLNTRNDLLGFAKMALSANNLSFSLTARTGLCVEVIISSSQLNSSGDSSLTSTFTAGYHVVGIFSSSSLAVRTCYLFLN